MKTNTQSLFNKYESKFDKYEKQPLGKPFVVSAILLGTGEILFENKPILGSLAKSEKQRGVGHVFFVDPETEEQYICWFAKDGLKNAINNETTNIILVKVERDKKKDKEGNKVDYYRISEAVVTNEEGSSFLS